MKKTISILLIILLTLILISCGGNTETNKKTDESKNTVVEDTRDTKVVEEKKDTKIVEEKKDTKIVEEKKTTKVEESKKQKYLDKLDKIKIGLKDLDELYAGSTLEAKYAASQEYERWDAVINEIYSVLKTQLSKTEMSKLNKEELQWIKDKEAKAKEDAAPWEGGTGQQQIYTSSLANTTRDRCYELVNKYMK